MTGDSMSNVLILIMLILLTIALKIGTYELRKTRRANRVRRFRSEEIDDEYPDDEYFDDEYFDDDLDGYDEYNDEK